MNSYLNRRQLLQRTACGFGALALHDIASAASNPLAARIPGMMPKAKRVIFLFMGGGPSQMDLFDPKPELIKHAGKPLPDSYGAVETRRKVAQNPLLAPVKPFRKHGQSGIEISDFLPHMAEIADEMCVIRSCHGDSVNHPQSVYQMNTGSILMGKPSLGSWVSYGLGSENADLPAYIVLTSFGSGRKDDQPLYDRLWGAGFLATKHQGVRFRNSGDPVLYLADPAGIDRQMRLDKTPMGLR
jgi:hypothetical protein